MSDFNDVNLWKLIFESAKYIFSWIGSIITGLVLLIIGINRRNFNIWVSEHNEMLSFYRDKTGKSALELSTKKEKEWQEVIEEIKKIKHDIAQIRQDKVNLTTVFDDIHEIANSIKK